MNLSKRSYQKELLDQSDIPFSDIQKNMQELNTINTLLGGHAITIQGVRSLIENQREITVCEIGCGGGDNLKAIYAWGKKRGLDIKMIGIDMNEHCIAVANTQTDIGGQVQWIIDDYRNVVFQTKPDIIFSSLFCHHFTEEELSKQLLWMQNNSQIGFFINDLQRYWFAYYSIKFLTLLFSRSYLVKNDAPLSVARGFHKSDWQSILTKASIAASISWKWAFRYLIVSKNVDQFE